MRTSFIVCALLFSYLTVLAASETHKEAQTHVSDYLSVTRCEKRSPAPSCIISSDILRNTAISKSIIFNLSALNNV